MSARWLAMLFSLAVLLILGGAATYFLDRDRGSDLDTNPAATPSVSFDAFEITTNSPVMTVSTPTPEPEPIAPVAETATSPSHPTTPVPATATPFPPARLANVAPAAPSRLIIPRIGVDATVVPVGITDDGQLEAPTDYSTVGWYTYGPVPGEQGRAVMDGHLDSKSGPTVFYHLRDLAPGDEIIVQSHGTDPERTFVVRESASYPNDDAPLDRIYRPSERSELILITCDGVFDRGGGGYQERRIIFAELRPDTGT
jgi:sortase (surface protein transpeptidase)